MFHVVSTVLMQEFYILMRYGDSASSHTAVLLSQAVTHLGIAGLDHVRLLLQELSYL